MTERPGLRQRKKDRTRARLVEVSDRLFRRQGYEATTLEQIADEAEVSVPTLLAYFESKERLALARDYGVLELLQAELEDPDRTDDTFAVWRRFVEVGSRFAMDNRAEYLRSMRFTSATPQLARGVLALLQRYEEVLAAGLAADNGTDPRSDLPTALLATTLAFGNHTVLRQWVQSGGEGDLAAQTLAVVDFAKSNFPKLGRRLA